MKPQPTETATDDALTAFFRDLIAMLDDALAAKRDTPPAKRKTSEAHFADALEAPAPEDEWDLLVQCLNEDPGNVEALLSVLDLLELSVEEETEALRRAVALGARRLGKRTLQNPAGLCWGHLETRPYLRARAWLADNLAECCKADEALVEREALLTLNPGDNQGIRYLLLPAYLERGRMEDAARLFAAYPDEAEFSTTFAWGRALDRLLNGDEAGAAQALAQARGQNGFTEAYILGHRKLAKFLPNKYVSGSREEAECFAEPLIHAWAAHPDALKWLAAQPKPQRR